jgi:hypothetical protein
VRPAGRIGSLALAAVAATAAACGGDDGSLSEEELIARGDEICREGQGRFAEIQAEQPASAAEAAEQTEQLIVVTADQIERLAELEPPEELSDDLERYLDSRERTVRLFRRGLAAAERGDESGYIAAQAKVAAGAAERLRLAREVGFEVCSEPQRPPPRGQGT